MYKTSKGSRMSSSSVFMPVEVAARIENKEVRVAVCVQAAFGHLRRHRLVEWFEMQRLLGEMKR